MRPQLPEPQIYEIELEIKRLERKSEDKRLPRLKDRIEEALADQNRVRFPAVGAGHVNVA